MCALISPRRSSASSEWCWGSYVWRKPQNMNISSSGQLPAAQLLSQRANNTTKVKHRPTATNRLNTYGHTATHVRRLQCQQKATTD